MLVYCGWCHRFMKEKPPFKEKKISHGLCKTCKKKVDKEIKEYQKKGGIYGKIQSNNI